jgi:hypothetical protein
MVLGENMESNQGVNDFKDKLSLEYARYKNRKNKGGRTAYKISPIQRAISSSFKINMDFNEIPLCYRIYIQQNRIFEQYV